MIEKKGGLKMIRFDRIENDRLYLGFTESELDKILVVLEKHLPDEQVTDRLDALYMTFRKKMQERE